MSNPTEDDILDEALDIYASVEAEKEDYESIRVSYSIDKEPTGEETISIQLTKEN